MSTSVPVPGGEIARRTLQFFWIADYSGSMSGKKIATLNQAIREARYDAIRFCNELSRGEGLRPCYYEVTGLPRGLDDGGAGYRLPTEAEWEYACRARTGRRYCFGDGWARLCDYAWYSANSQKQTCPVGRKRATDFGLFDRHGNVWEWCFDSYERSYYRQSPDVDPLRWPKTAYRVVRGGSWNDRPPTFGLQPARGSG